jgi:two-component system sensor histidine kinase QseC
MIRSLRNRLTTLTLTSIGCVMLPLLALSYVKVVEEVGELSDARLAQSAKTLEAVSTHLGDRGTDAPIEVPNWVRPKGTSEAAPQGHGYETQVGFQYWSTANRLGVTTQDLKRLAFDAAPVGFADVAIDRREWRVYTKIGDDGGFFRAAERYDSRREIVRDLLLQNLLPLGLGLPVLALLTRWSVRKGLQPISDTTKRIDARTIDDTAPLDVHDAPDEIAPLVGALNGLLQRLARVLDKERQFTANAAHELRTPLAGARTHIDTALASEYPVERRAALDDARASIDRMTRLVNQMLELARWDAATAAKAMTRVDLAAIASEEIRNVAPIAAERAIDVLRSFASTVPPVRGWEAGLRVLVRNLLDNALRYGAPGGNVAVEIRPDDDGVLLAVEDDGPGIDASMRDAVLGRFQRGENPAREGVGLGLPIAKRIAEVHRASLRLANAANGRGLRVEVRFPRNT